MAKDCPDNEKSHPITNNGGSMSSTAKPAEVNLVEYSRKKTKKVVPEVMMTKRDRPNQELDASESSR
jgi:hypothetical protein